MERPTVKINLNKILFTTILGFGFILFNGCDKKDPALLQKIHSVSLPRVTVDLRMTKVSNGTHFSYNISPDEGLVNQLAKEDVQLLGESVEKMRLSMEKRLGKEIRRVNKAEFKNIEKYLSENDPHVFVPSGYFYFDIENKEAAAAILKLSDSDAVANIQVAFFQNQYDQPFVGTFSKIKVRALIEVVDSQGHTIISTEIWGESKNSIREESILDFANSNKKSRNLKRYYSLKSDFEPLFKEAFDDLVLKCSNL